MGNTEQQNNVSNTTPVTQGLTLNFSNQQDKSCQICQINVKETEFQQHFDVNHYGTVKEINNGSFVIQCILCGQSSQGSIAHNSHTSQKHPYTDVKIDKTNTHNGSRIYKKLSQEWQLNKLKKARIVKLNSQNDFQILQQIQTNHYQASVKGKIYNVIKYAKEYKKEGYHQQQIQAELVWFKVFRQKSKCSYYYFSIQPGKKHIFCKSYIFLQKNT